MAFNAFCYFPKSKVKGETQDDVFKKEGAFEIQSFEIGAENNINIGSASSGGGAGKATFKTLTIDKVTDSASCALFGMLCEGKHFDDMTIVLRRAGGASNKSGADDSYLTFEFKLVMIADISWNGADGDDVCKESLSLEYGSMKVTYTQQDKQGKTVEKFSNEWSRVLNKAINDV